MYKLQDITITRISKGDAGIFVYATYPHWHHEFTFFILPDGKVKGWTAQGQWLDLSWRSSLYIRDKLQTFLKKHGHQQFFKHLLP